MTTADDNDVEAFRVLQRRENRAAKNWRNSTVYDVSRETNRIELMAVVILNAIVPRETQRRNECVSQATLYELL